MFTILLAQAYYAYPAAADETVFSPTDAQMFGLLLIVLCALLSFFVHAKMQSAMRRYGAEPAPLTGAQTAERMLAAHGLGNVRITCTPGKLTDHYNPLDRTVNLSEAVYHEATVASMAVAAHECGHAVQHACAYPWLGLRSSMVPMVNIGTRLGQIVLFVGLLLLGATHDPTIAWLGLILFGSATLFAFVTLPVEFDASRRALAWLDRSDYTNRAMQGQASSALRWAAMTYVAAALSSLAMLAYYALLILSRSSRRD